VARKPVVLEPHTGVGVPVVSQYVGRGPEARGNFVSWMLRPKARGPRWLGN
jgi:hypothetical protein